MVEKIAPERVEEAPAAGDNRMRLLVHPQRTGNKRCQLVLLKLLPGHEFPLHLHPSSEDVIYVLRGEVRLRVGEAELELREGELVVVPEATPHSAHNPTKLEAELLVFQAPLPEFRFLEERA